MRGGPGRGPVAERTSGNDAGARLRLETRAMLLHESNEYFACVCIASARTALAFARAGAWGCGSPTGRRRDRGCTGMGFADAIRGGEAEREIGESLAENPYGTCGERACCFFLELTSDAYGHILHGCARRAPRARARGERDTDRHVQAATGNAASVWFFFLHLG